MRLTVGRLGLAWFALSLAAVAGACASDEGSGSSGAAGGDANASGGASAGNAGSSGAPSSGGSGGTSGATTGGAGGSMDATTDASDAAEDASLGGSAGSDDGAAGTSSGGAAGSGASGGTSGSSGSDASAGSGGSAGLDAATDAPITFATFCGSAGAPKISGQVFAPNGVDPVPFATVYIPFAINPIVPGVACDACINSSDPVWITVTTGVDGKFVLDLATVPQSSSVQVTVRKGRFRKTTSVTPNCGQTLALPKTATTLPGTSAQGDKPKIAVGSGNVDHLDKVVLALGIPEFDCYEGRATYTTPNCPTAEATGQKVLALLKNKTLLDTYNLLFLSCAPNIWSSYSAGDRATIATNLTAWVTAGGRLIATDHSYDYVSQTFPNAIVWHGPSGPPWQIGTLSGAGANVGLAPSSGSTFPGTITDANITAWLKLPQINVTSAPSVSITGWLTPWSVQKSVASTTTTIVHGMVDWEYPKGSGKQTSDYPLTTQFKVANCGRVIYSSYHTSTNSTALNAQERILEYLMLDVASCLVD